MIFKGGNMDKLWMILEREIQKKYELSEQEWVQIEISKRNKVHCTIVSDKQITRDDVKTLLQKELNGQREHYTVGFINLYTIEQAEQFHISKEEKRKELYSWADGLNVDGVYEQKEQKDQPEIISFYSYKGGVGRTIAMIQTAYNLAKAGKRVLLLDLDIEAPSLHTIFQENIRNEMSGIQYGMIEYLYRAVVQKSEKVDLNDIYCPILMSDLDGAMFLIPALLQMNREYIYEIGRLQTERIQEKDVFPKLFSEIKEKLAIDYIFVDTRAGFNPWGSLSLLSLSTQVIFVAYPNAENIEGLNIAFEMMDKIGKSRYAVAMSKVVASEEGKKKAAGLFDSLHITQEQAIDIYYKETIALSSVYPVTGEDAIEAYSQLSDYIIDNKKIEINRQYLANGKKKEMLGSVMKKNKNKYMLRDVSRFIRRVSTSILVYRFWEELNGIEDMVMENYSLKEKNIFVPQKSYLFYDPVNDEENNAVMLDETLDEEQRVLKFIKNASCNSKLYREKGFGQIQTLEMLRMALTEKIDPDNVFTLGTESEKKQEQYFESTSNVIVIIRVLGNVFEKNPARYIANMMELIKYNRKNNSEIQFGFAVEYGLWKNHAEAFLPVKGEILELQPGINDIRSMIYANINEPLFRPYLHLVREKEVHGAMPERMEKINNRIASEQERRDILDLTIGVRKDISRYSISMEEYLYHFLEQNKEISYVKILDAIYQAVEYEKTNSVDDDRLISISNLEKALRKLVSE